MSFFQAEGIILHIQKSSEKEMFLSVFFEAYGIVLVKKTKKSREKSLDIGEKMNCEIFTQQDRKIPSIGNIRVLHFFSTENTEYRNLELFLKTLSLVRKELPFWVPNYEIFHILSEIIERKPISYQKLLLWNLKIRACFWTLPEENGNILTSKLLRFIHHAKIQEIFKLKEFSQELEQKIESLF